MRNHLTPINFDRVPDVSKHAWSPFLILHLVVVFRFSLCPLVYTSWARNIARYSVGFLRSSTYERTERKKNFLYTHKTLPQKRFTWSISNTLVFLISLWRIENRIYVVFSHQESFWQCSNTVISIFQHVDPASSTRVVIVIDIVHDNKVDQTVVTSCIRKCWIL